ncbi:hypothetical protein SDC9_149488 [bioreactor metagenome]|uniref:Uncharacterized protein n=1 Tax=bioreactor metagenome TaxID=1076179 RepID=A0A645ENQ0_9ZZZZ
MVGDIVVAADKGVCDFHIRHHLIEHQRAADKSVMEDRLAVSRVFAAHLAEELVYIMYGFHLFRPLRNRRSFCANSR